MTSQKTVLFIGHSHVACIAAAAEKTGARNAHVLNISSLAKTSGQPQLNLPEKIIRRLFKTTKRPEQMLIRRIKRAAPVSAPDAICLCVSGNEHNVLGILENPVPFAVGEARAGAAPSEAPTRHFIPSQLMRAHFKEHLPLALIAQLFEAFPNAKRLYMSPPPPVSDWAHIKSHPGVFRDKLALGPAPAALKMQLYSLQLDVLKEQAEKSAASFVDVPSALLDQAGFLAPQFYNTDPTHGNLAYGELMLNDILGRL